MTNPLEPNDLSHLPDEEFLALCPQGFHGTGDFEPNFRALCEELAKLARQDHYRCEDSWYSCPKSPDGCANDSAGDECTCGADSHNDKIDELLARAALKTYGNCYVQRPEPLTDEAILALADEYGHHEGNIFQFARAVLERWG